MSTAGMKRALSVLALLGLGTAGGAAPGIPQAPGLTRGTPREVSAGLGNMIRAAQQVILYAPQLRRVDVAESIRQALVGRGTEVILLTDRRNFWTSNSLTLRVLWMGAKTYDVRGSGVPFLIIDGTVVSGPGVSGAGKAYTDPATRADIVRWTNGVLRTQKPLLPEAQTVEWMRRAGLLPKESDLPPKTPDPRP